MTCAQLRLLCFFLATLAVCVPSGSAQCDSSEISLGEIGFEGRLVVDESEFESLYRERRGKGEPRKPEHWGGCALLVESCRDASPAWDAGIRPDDLITSLSGPQSSEVPACLRHSGLPPSDELHVYVKDPQGGTARREVALPRPAEHPCRGFSMEGRDKALTDWSVETLPEAERTGLGLDDAGVRLVKAGDLKLDGLEDGDVLIGIGEDPARSDDQVAEYLRSADFPLVLTRRVESLVDGFVETYDDPIVVDRTYLETDCTEIMLDAAGGVVLPSNTGTTYQRRYFIPRVGWNLDGEDAVEVEIIGSLIDGNRANHGQYGIHYLHFNPEEHAISSVEVEAEGRRIYGRDAFMLPSNGDRERFVAVIDSRKLFAIEPDSGRCLWESNLEDGGDTRYPDRVVGRGLVRDVDVIALYDRGRKKSLRKDALPPMYWLVRADNGNRFWQGSVEQFDALDKVEYQEPMSPLPDLAGDKKFRLDLLLDEHPEITYDVSIYTSELSSKIKSIVVTRTVDRRDWQVLRAEFQGQLVHAWSEPNLIHLLVYIAESRSYAHVKLAVRSAGL